MEDGAVTIGKVGEGSRRRKEGSGGGGALGKDK